MHFLVLFEREVELKVEDTTQIPFVNVRKNFKGVECAFFPSLVLHSFSNSFFEDFKVNGIKDDN